MKPALLASLFGLALLAPLAVHPAAAMHGSQYKAHGTASVGPVAVFDATLEWGGRAQGNFGNAKVTMREPTTGAEHATVHEAREDTSNVQIAGCQEVVDPYALEGAGLHVEGVLRFNLCDGTCDHDLTGTYLAAFQVRMHVGPDCVR